MIDELRRAGGHADRFAVQDQPHEIEKVAAFFDKSAARIRIETIPGADLGQERLAVLLQGQHLDTASHRVCALNERGNRRHVAIFHRDPDGRFTMPLKSKDLGLANREIGIGFAIAMGALVLANILFWIRFRRTGASSTFKGSVE